MTEKSSISDSRSKSGPAGFWSFENLRSLAFLIVLIFALRWSVASPYHVPTGSMEPTIKVGDRLLANKLAYNLKFPFTDYVMAEWGTPEKGDIIVFRYPKNPDLDYVKRVVGVAGDEIQVIDEILYINGEPQKRVDHNHDRSILEDIDDFKDRKLLYKETLNGVDHWTMQNTPMFQRFISQQWPPDGVPYKVPENSVFAVGDNRDNSTDSRSWKEVPLSHVRGKALMVLWSAYWPSGASWPTIRFSRFGSFLDGDF